MEDKEREATEKRIYEKIVPRKQYKRVIAIAASITFSVLLFGAAAGAAFALSQKFIHIEDDTSGQTIVIARDEMTTGNETTASTAAPDTTAASATEISAADESTAGGENAQALSMKELYSGIQSRIVTVSYAITAEGELFGTSIVSSTEHFGICIAESDESLYILTDLPQEDPETAVITVNGQSCSVQGFDRQERLLVLKALKTDLPGLQTAPLGNSFTAAVTDTVYMAGAPFNRVAGIEEGKISFIESRKDTVDGYEQNLYTDMYREPGGCAVLLSENGSVIGWISDTTCDETEGTAVASGISVIKYLIEDMCSGADTAYIGITGREITQIQADGLGIPAGFYIQSVEEGSPAFDAGMQAGDCLANLNGAVVSNSHDIELVIDSLIPGRETEAVIQRKGASGYETVTLNITVGSR